MIYRFVLEGNEIIHSSESERPYAQIPQFFGVPCENRVDQEYESKTGGDGRFYLHSKLINGSIRILVLFSPNRIGNKELLSETLDTKCLQLVAGETKDINWWFRLEQDLFESRNK